jgi:nitrate/TMAO reductase-like tetraheme cytochrome c subunit
VILFMVGGYAFASTQERQDSFCASCHTQPEVLFYQRSTAAAPSDLASDHTTKKVLCIDCHDGSGVFGHVQAVLLGARNTVIFYSGTAVQPARQTVPIQDDACLKCHEPVVLLLARNNHEHTLLARWQAIDSHAAGCVSCHTAHTTDGPALHGFLSMARSQVVCDDCHRVLRDAKR